MSRHQFDRPGNPRYGDGLYRRRIRLSHRDAHVPDHESMPGACYSYAEGVVEHAVGSHDSVRDFSTTPEQLLEFRQGSSE